MRRTSRDAQIVSLARHNVWYEYEKDKKGLSKDPYKYLAEAIQLTRRLGL